MRSSGWITSPIQGRIIETIYLGIYFPDVSQLFPTILSGKGRKRDKFQGVWPLCYFSEVAGGEGDGRWEGGEQLQLGHSMCLTPPEKCVFLIFSSFSFLVNPSILFYIISSGRLLCCLFFLSFLSSPTCQEKQTAARQFFSGGISALVGWGPFCSREMF